MPHIDAYAVSALLAGAAARLKAAGVDSPAFDARELLAFAAGAPDHAALFAFDTVGEETARRFDKLVEQRCRRYPLQYILGFWEFYGRRFAVREGVLIPRADTECLAEAAIRRAAGYSRPRIIDLCSGSGALAITLALEIPGARVDALELSPAALEILRENAAALEAPVCVIEGDVFAFEADAAYDLIVSNPPYIRSDELGGLQPEVLCEPRMALDAGADGMRFYNAIIAGSQAALAPGGMLLLEAGFGQARDIADLMRGAGYGESFIERDLGGIERVVGAQWPK